MFIENCMFCKTDVEIVQKDNGNRTKYICLSCGTYEVSSTAKRMLSKKPGNKERAEKALKKATCAKKGLLIIAEVGHGLMFELFNITK